MDNSYLIDQSRLMAILRLPLIIIVVFIHLIPEAIKSFSLDSYTIISELISHNIGRVAVPSFFFISGYFLFYKTAQSYSKKTYIENLKKKTKTLLIPYLAWNIIYFMLICLKVYASQKLGLSVYDYEVETINTPPHILLITKPLDYPLWYIRDLISINIISVFIYYALRYLKLYYLLFIAIIYHFSLMPNIYVLSDNALYFVSLGAYCSMYRINFIALFNKYRALALFIFSLSLIYALVNNDNPNIEYLIRFYIPFGLIVLFIYFYHFSKYLSRLKLKYNSLSLLSFVEKELSLSIFFIYAVHTIYLVNWVNAFYLKLGLNPSLSYFLKGFSLLFICVVLRRIFSFIMPKTMSILSGGRS